MRGMETHAQITTLHLLQIESQRDNSLFQGQAFRFTLLEETRIIYGNGSLVREQFDDLYVFLAGYLAIRRVIQRQETQNFLHAQAKQWNNQRIFRMPAARFIVIQRFINTPHNISKSSRVFMRNKIALANLKFWSHKTHHLLNCDRMLAHDASPLLRSTRKSDRR